MQIFNNKQTMSCVQVLHCAETVKGGIATYLSELLPSQVNTFGDNSVVVVVPESQASQVTIPPGVVLLTFPDRFGRIRNAITLSSVVASACKRYSPLVVHIHSTFAGVSVRPSLALFSNVRRVVYCPHGWAWDRKMSGFARFFTKKLEIFLSYFCDRIVCISEYERNAAVEAGISTRKLVVVLNGISRHRPQHSQCNEAWPGNGFKLLFVGRFDYQKGVDLLCSALISLGDDASAIFAGGSVLEDGCDILFPSNSRSIGWATRDKIESLFDCADILVMPSRWEGFGLVAIEAMRAGLPVIATRVGGLVEIVVDGNTGLIIEPNSADSIVQAVRSLSPLSLRSMGELGRSRFLASFSTDRVHKELCSVYGRS